MKRFLLAATLALFSAQTMALDMAELEAKADEIRAEKKKKLNELFQAAKAKGNFEAVQPTSKEEVEAEKLVNEAAKSIPVKSGVDAWSKAPSAPKAQNATPRSSQVLPAAMPSKKAAAASPQKEETETTSVPKQNQPQAETLADRGVRSCVKLPIREQRVTGIGRTARGHFSEAICNY